MKSKHIPIVAGIVLLLALLTVVAFILLRKTPDTEPPPLLTSPSASATSVELELEAGDDAGGDADQEAGKPPKPGQARITRLIACCRVIGQNAASAGDPMTRGTMLQAAAVCEASARSGNLDAVDATLRKYEVPCH